MRRMDKAIRSVGNSHRQENYSGPLASTSSGGHIANVNNLYNSQVRDAMMVMPYGISSRPHSGVKAQAVVNDNNNSTVVGIYDPNRPKVNVGEICIYSTGGCSIYLSKDDTITIKASGTTMKVSSSGIKVVGTVDASGLSINGRSVESIIDEKVNSAISRLG